MSRPRVLEFNGYTARAIAKKNITFIRSYFHMTRIKRLPIKERVLHKTSQQNFLPLLDGCGGFGRPPIEKME